MPVNGKREMVDPINAFGITTQVPGEEDVVDGPRFKERVSRSHRGALAAQPSSRVTLRQFYLLSLPDGSSFQGFGTIPSENVTNIDSKTLTLAPTDTSTIQGFVNIFCHVNGNCTESPGGIVSGTWNQTKLSSSHSITNTVSHSGPVQFVSHGSMDDFSAIAQFSVLGNSFQGSADIGTQHSTQIDVTVP